MINTILIVAIILGIVSMVLNAFLLYKYIPTRRICRKEIQIDKKIKAEIAAMCKNKKLTPEQLDPKNWALTAEELDDLLSDD